MDRSSKTMVLVTACLLLLLIIKSTVIDPKGELVGDMEIYRLYMLNSAHLKEGLLEKTGLLTYRAVKVNQDSIDGSTEVMFKAEDSDEWFADTLKGEYSGKVRGYLFYFIPIKDINFKGGVVQYGK